ncbi:hypothetical protein [Halosegnis longus]|uniref:Uncharacterized protein n=1 Tax=Halosegnis longus TaxID=2216012 RepID=A0AAJ4R7G2_9EURY|nr:MULTISPECIES: hypothetical protein [Halobacteriales]RNJ26056.1 hypothetical protein Nmn1133_04725 [Salella cibi]
MVRRRRLSVLAAAAVLAPLSVGVASAHEIGGSRFDAPIPLSLLFVGAAGTVALTALWLAVVGDDPSDGDGWTVATVDAYAVGLLAGVARLGFGLAVAGALVAGYTGRQVAAENLATVFTWPVWFRGIGLVAVLVGSPWRVLSPWRALYDGLCRLEGRELAARAYPERLGSWPAVAGFLLLVGLVENATIIPRSPALTSVTIALYALAMVAGGVLFGSEWFDRADPLGVFYRLLGRVAPVSTTRTESGSLAVSLRPPWRGSTRPFAHDSLVAFVVAAVYTVSFDGFTNTRTYQTLLFDARDLLGFGPSTGILLYVLGLVGFVLLFELAARAGDTLAALGSGGLDTNQGAPLAFAPTVLPIAAAYDVAHNYPYVVENLARLLELTAGVAVSPLGWLSLPMFWGSQVVLVVAGHVVAVVAAHRVAIHRYPSPTTARRGHFPLVVLMVGYTVLSLWIISRPVVG